MTVFIAHAPQDKDVATALAAVLSQRGQRVELEDGERAMVPLSPRDTLVGLVSKDFVFSPWKLRLEKRLLDAWADEQLVMVKLDHHFSSVGLRDLPFIDASFEAQRDFTWTKVANAVAARGVAVAAPPPPASDFFGGSQSPQSGASAPPAPAPKSAQDAIKSQHRPPRVSIDYETAPDAPAPQMPGSSGSARSQSAARKRMAQKRGPSSATMMGLLGIIFGGGLTAYLLWQGERIKPPASSPAPGALPDVTAQLNWVLDEATWRALLIGGAILIGLLGMAIIAINAAKRAKLEAQMGKPQSRGRMAQQQASTGAPPSAESAEPLPEATQAAPSPEALPSMVFISYARADQTAVTPLAAAVRGSGRGVWIDTEHIEAGTSWAGEIVRAIKSAGPVLVMCSPRSFESDQVKREVYLADRYKKPILPVFLESAEPPEDFEFFFAGVQWLKLFEAPEAERAAILAKALPAA